MKCLGALSTPLGLYHSAALLPLLNVWAQEPFITLSSKHWEIIIQNSQYTEIGLYTIMLLEVKKWKLFCISFKAVSLYSSHLSTTDKMIRSLYLFEKERLHYCAQHGSSSQYLKKKFRLLHLLL